MKKIVLIFAAMLAMAQMNAATTDDAVNNEANKAEAATVATQAEDEDDSSIVQPFKIINDETTKHWTIAASGFYFGMGVKHNWEAINNSFEIGMLNFLSINYNSLHGQNLSLGVGLHHRSYSMKRPNMLVRDDHNLVTVGVYPSDNVNEIKKRTSNLNIWTIQVPLMFSQRIVKKLEVSVAGILNWNCFARVDNHYEMNKIDHDTHFKGLKQNKVSFDAMAALTYGGTGIYCRFSPAKFFKDGYGPEIKNTWTMGITLGL